MVLTTFRRFFRKKKDMNVLDQKILNGTEQDALKDLIEFFRECNIRLRMLRKRIDMDKFMMDKDDAENSKIFNEIAALIKHTYRMIATQRVMRFVLDHEAVVGSLIEWLCATGRQPGVWKQEFNALPDSVQARFTRRLVYECPRLTNFILSWIDKELLTRVIEEVFEELIGRKKGFPVSLPPIYLSRINTIDPRSHQKLDKYYREYLRFVDRNIATVVHYLKLVPRSRRWKKTGVGIEQAVQRISTPITTLHTTFLTAVPTAALANVYAITDAKDRMKQIETIRTLQKGLLTRKQKFLDTLILPGYGLVKTTQPLPKSSSYRTMSSSPK